MMSGTGKPSAVASHTPEEKKQLISGDESSDDEKTTVIYLALDIEKKGTTLAYPLIQIGAVWGTNKSDLQKRSFCFDYKDAAFEPRCYEEFWCKHKDIYERICAEAIEPKLQWKKFGQFLDDLEASGATIELLTDNPAFDIATIDYYLHTELGRRGLQYNRDMSRRKIHDSSMRDKGIPKYYMKAVTARAHQLAKHSHWAVDDAELIFTFWTLSRSVVSILHRAESEIGQLLKIPSLRNQKRNQTNRLHPRTKRASRGRGMPKKAAHEKA